VKLYLIAAGGVRPHRLVAIDSEEQMPVVGRDYGVLDAGLRQPLDGARDVADDLVHDAPSLSGEARLAGVIDLL
jgi:hypothetical protein